MFCLKINNFELRFCINVTNFRNEKNGGPLCSSSLHIMV